MTTQYKLIDLQTKGGPGSGNFGHAGRPGKRGGSSTGSNLGAAPKSSSNKVGKGAMNLKEWQSMSVPDRFAKWGTMSEDQKTALADGKNSIRNEINSRLSYAGKRPSVNESGVVSKRLKQIGDGITPDASAKIESNVNRISGFLRRSGVTDDKLRREIELECVDALAVQEMESNGRQLGDHGVRHVLGDMDMALQVMKAIPNRKFSEQDRAEVSLAAVFHDTGYLTPVSKALFGERHPKDSEIHYNENLRGLMEKALGSKAADRIGSMIRTHAQPNLDWEKEPVASALRLADNAALFHKEKLPGLFHHAKKNIQVLEDFASKKLTLDEAKGQMRKNIDATEGLSQKVKDDLYKAVDEVSQITPKFTLGMLGGNINNVVWKKDHPHLELTRNEDARRLQKHLDLGQRQFGKFAESFGIDPDYFKDTSNFEIKNGAVTVLSASITGTALKAQLIMLQGYFFYGQPS